jgi:hypothetical protein
MKVARALPTEVLMVWEQVRPLLAEAFQFETHTYGVDDLLDPLLSQEAQLWAAMKNGEIVGALVTSIEQGPKAKVCNIMHFGGKDVEGWIDEMDKALVDFCKENGCVSYETVTDRKGFSKLVPGFEVKGFYMVKRVGDE